MSDECNRRIIERYWPAFAKLTEYFAKPFDPPEGRLQLVDAGA